MFRVGYVRYDNSYIESPWLLGWPEPYTFSKEPETRKIDSLGQRRLNEAGYCDNLELFYLAKSDSNLGAYWYVKRLGCLLQANQAALLEGDC